MCYVQVPYTAANLYEAAYLFAVAINQTLTEGGNITDGQSVARTLWGRDFPCKWHLKITLFSTIRAKWNFGADKCNNLV